MSDNPTNQSAEKPVFDFSNLSWREAKQTSTLQKKLSDAQTSGDLEQIEAAFVAMQNYIAKTLVSVPRSWLVKAAPEAVDWSQGVSIDWLRSNKFGALTSAFSEAQTADQASGE